MDRILGKIEGDDAGPLIIFVGGLHGNEVAGVKAICNVFKTLKSKNVPIKGKIVGLSGNIAALKQRSRFIDYDLNRCWDPEFVKRLNRLPRRSAEAAENREVLSLLNAIEQESSGNYTRKVFVDLHTTSSDNGNFVIIPEEEARSHIVRVLKLPIVVDLDKYLAGTLLQFMYKRGYFSFAFEGGLMGSDRALNLHTAGIWELIKACGAVTPEHVNDFSYYDRITAGLAKNLPHLVSVNYRHWVNEDDCFKMKPGYHNFQKILKGETLAYDKTGEIRARCDGLMFMPLYQDFGNDGFFIVEEVEQRPEYF